jgi:hypothetical protein
LPQHIPIGSNDLTAVYGSGTPLQLASPGFIHTVIMHIFETFEDAGGHFRTIVLGKIKNFGQ